MGNFRELEVYRLASRVADSVYEAVRLWPDLDRRTTAVQVIRAADSVPANIAEGYGRWTRKDLRHFLIVARGSSFELQHWIETAARRGLDLPREARATAHRVSQMLNRLIKSLERTTSTEDRTPG